MTEKEMTEKAWRYEGIYSELGLRSMIHTNGDAIKNKYFEIVEVEAGRLYNPNMKKGILVALNKELICLTDNLNMCHLALKLCLEKHKK